MKNYPSATGYNPIKTPNYSASRPYPIGRDDFVEENQPAVWEVAGSIHGTLTLEMSSLPLGGRC